MGKLVIEVDRLLFIYRAKFKFLDNNNDIIVQYSSYSFFKIDAIDSILEEIDWYVSNNKLDTNNMKIINYIDEDFINNFRLKLENNHKIILLSKDIINKYNDKHRIIQ